MDPANDISRPGDSPVIVITLTATTTGFEVPKRTLRLTRQNPTMRIGRASKVPSKGFMADEYNAWFDSPVMSRAHADLRVDFTAPRTAVTIEDVGSLHGTFHQCAETGKETQVIPKEPITIKDGDTLRFGVDIFRTSATFPPYSVAVQVEKQSAFADNRDTAINHFSVPEYDDVPSDDDLQVLPPWSAQRTKEHIDLTSTSSTYIDLTSDAEPNMEVLPISPSVPAQSQSSEQLEAPAIPSVQRILTAVASPNFDDISEDDEERDSINSDSDADSMDSLDYDDDDGDTPSSVDSDGEISEGSHESDSSSQHMLDTDEEDILDESTNESEDEELTSGLSNPALATHNIFRKHGSQVGEPNEEDFPPVAAAVWFSSDNTNESNRYTMQSTAEILGDMHGKREFFAAREQNRLTVSMPKKCRSPPPESAIRETLGLGLDERQSASPSPVMPEPQTTDSATESKNIELEPPAATSTSAWDASGADFINTPGSARPVAISTFGRAESPELDMSSAYNFQQSKLKACSNGKVRRLTIDDLLTNEPAKEPAQLQLHTQQAGSEAPQDNIEEACKVPSEERSQDLVEGTPTALTENPWSTSTEMPAKSSPGKRTYLEAFDGEGAEDQTPAAGPSAELNITQTMSQSEPHNTNQGSVVSVPVSLKTERPTKRARLAQAAACVAIGGAGVLSALIMSAPSFA